MGAITFILGGAGSGKSKFALKLAGERARVAFIATCASGDGEMQKKIAAHREERPSHWRTVEAGETPFAPQWPNGKTECLLIDSLTLWVSGLLVNGEARAEILRKSAECLNEARARFEHTVIVSDEVGFGIVPENKLAREFREMLGAVNQKAAETADQVFLVVAGQPVQLK